MRRENTHLVANAKCAPKRKKEEEEEEEEEEDIRGSCHACPMFGGEGDEGVHVVLVI